MMAEDDGQVDMSSALLLSTLGPSQIASGLCPDDPERSATIVAAPLAPGYDLLFADQQLTPEQRLDAADEVAAAMSRKLRATGLDATELGGAEVLRCTELDDG